MRKFMDDYTLMGFAFRFMMQRKRILAPYLKDSDLNLVDSILMILVEKKPGINQDRIGEITLFDGAIITRSLKKLAKRDLVTREVDQNNRRRKVVYITELGKDFNGKIRSKFVDVNKEIFAGITDEESKLLGKALEKVYANLDRVKIPTNK